MEEKILNLDSLDYEDYPDEQIIKIEGIKYSYGFFKALSGKGLPEGEKFEIVKRKEDGTAIIKKLYEDEDPDQIPVTLYFDKKLIEKIKVPDDFFKTENILNSRIIFGHIFDQVKKYLEKNAKNKNP